VGVRERGRRRRRRGRRRRRRRRKRRRRRRKRGKPGKNERKNAGTNGRKERKEKERAGQGAEGETHAAAKRGTIEATNLHPQILELVRERDLTELVPTLDHVGDAVGQQLVNVPGADLVGQEHARADLLKLAALFESLFLFLCLAGAVVR
jgi:hypothetical protein